MNKKIAFVCFGEINTPIDRLNLKHDEGLEVIKNQEVEKVKEIATAIDNGLFFH